MNVVHVIELIVIVMLYILGLKQPWNLVSFFLPSSYLYSYSNFIFLDFTVYLRLGSKIHNTFFFSFQNKMKSEPFFQQECKEYGW